MMADKENICFVCLEQIKNSKDSSNNCHSDVHGSKRLVEFAEKYLEISINDKLNFKGKNVSSSLIFCQNCDKFISTCYILYGEMCRTVEKFTKQIEQLTGFLTEKEVMTRSEVAQIVRIEHLKRILTEHCKIKCNLHVPELVLIQAKEVVGRIKESGSDLSKNGDEVMGRKEDLKGSLQIKVESVRLAVPISSTSIDYGDGDNIVDQEKSNCDAILEWNGDPSSDFDEFGIPSANNSTEAEDSDLEEDPKRKRRSNLPRTKTFPDGKKRPFHCDICGKRFTRRTTVPMHKQKKHNIAPPPPTERPYTCEICAKNYKSKATLQKHGREIHGVKFQYGNMKKTSTTPNPTIKTEEVDSDSDNGSKVADDLQEMINFISEPENTQPITTTKSDEIPPNPISPDEKGMYNCDHCPKTCKTLKGISKHLLDLHKIKLNAINRPFKCSKCNQRFTRKHTLQLHLKLRHQVPIPSRRRREQPYSCDVCGTKFRFVSTLQRHVKNVHEATVSTENKIRVQGYICNQCPKRYKLKNSLAQHLRKDHSKELNYRCNHCSQEFNTRRLLTYHVFENHKQNKMTLSFMNRLADGKGNTIDEDVNENCVICGENFNSWLLLRKHLEKHEKEIPDESKTRKCYFCWSSFAHEQSIWAHLKSSQYHDFTKIEFPCDHVDHLGKNEWSFKKLEELEYHLRSDHGDLKILECSDCGWICLDNNMMDLHKLVHRQRVGWKHQCPICQNYFLRGDSLRNHYNIEHGVSLKLYRCQICSWGFPSKNGYRLHMKTHDNTGEDEDEADFKCSKCSKSYKTAVQLRDHLRCMHVLKQCQVCGIMIAKARLGRHMVMNHGGEGRHLCPVCGKRYKMLSSLKKHMSNHGQFRYNCQFCGKGYAVGKLLRRHVQRLHQNESEPVEKYPV